RRDLSASGLLDEAASGRRRALAGIAALRFPGPHARSDRAGSGLLRAGPPTERTGRVSLSPRCRIRLAGIDGPGCGADRRGLAQGDRPMTQYPAAAAMTWLSTCEV